MFLNYFERKKLLDFKFFNSIKLIIIILDLNYTCNNKYHVAKI